MNGKQTSNMKKVFFRKISKNKLKRWVKYAYVIIVISIGIWHIYVNNPSADPNTINTTQTGSSPAALALKQLPIKGRAPKTGYTRALFSDGWGNLNGCDARNAVLARDLVNTTYVLGTCKVAAGLLHDPYTGKDIFFTRGVDTSDDVQIDHIVSLSDAWQKGAQQISSDNRYALANDPLNLIAVDGLANQNKGDADAASWLPPNKDFRCMYVARQIAVKQRYSLWITQPEYIAMAQTLARCPDQVLPN